ncbi:MAG: terminase family protein [Acidobacteria bacterium]|nr:terminase family protein [Acidobacteriota bacterium]
MDDSRFKLAVKSTQIGFSFAAALEAVLDCLEKRTLWIILSRGDRQSLEFMQKVQQHTKALRITGSVLGTSFFDETTIRKREVKFPNGSRIIALPANPDTARGYTGNMILDEFAFHQQDREIWAAAFGRVSRGNLKLRVISTPNGRRGKFFELAQEAGLADGAPGSPLTPNPSRDCKGAVTSSVKRQDTNLWSRHWCDVHTAVRQGCPIDTQALRQAIGDTETWQQEYECVFHSDRENYIPIDLLVECEHPQASVSLPADWQPTPNRECYFGYDVGRVHDLAVVAVVEKVGDVFWTRALIEMPKTKFSAQEKALSDLVPFCLRGAVDATGLGKEMAERLAEKFAGRVEPVTFTAAIKHEMAIRMKRHFEERTLRIPDNRPLRRDLNAVKRIVTSAGNIRFDAERTADGHADRFWALALALHAAGHGSLAAPAQGTLDSDPEWYEPQEHSSIYEQTAEPRQGMVSTVPHIRAATARERPFSEAFTSTEPRGLSWV